MLFPLSIICFAVANLLPLHARCSSVIGMAQHGKDSSILLLVPLVIPLRPAECFPHGPTQQHPVDPGSEELTFEIRKVTLNRPREGAPQAAHVAGRATYERVRITKRT